MFPEYSGVSSSPTSSHASLPTPSQVAVLRWLAGLFACAVVLLDAAIYPSLLHGDPQYRWWIEPAVAGLIVGQVSLCAWGMIFGRGGLTSRAVIVGVFLVGLAFMTAAIFEDTVPNVLALFTLEWVLLAVPLAWARHTGIQFQFTAGGLPAAPCLPQRREDLSIGTSHPGDQDRRRPTARQYTLSALFGLTLIAAMIVAALNQSGFWTLELVRPITMLFALLATAAGVGCAVLSMRRTWVALMASAAMVVAGSILLHRAEGGKAFAANLLLNTTNVATVAAAATVLRVSGVRMVRGHQAATRQWFH